MIKYLIPSIILLALSGCTSTTPPFTPTQGPTDKVQAATATSIPSQTATASPEPTPTYTPVPTPQRVPLSSYEASRTSLYLPESFPLAVGFADFNQDGRQDVLTAGISGSRDTQPIRLYNQRASGSLAENRSLLPSPVTGVVTKAIRALGEIGDARAIDTLVQGLGHKNRKVRAAAADALGEIGDTRALEPLTKALEDRDKRVRMVVEGALERIRAKIT